MTDDELFTAIAGRRRIAADFVDSLSSSQLAVQSMCGEWDVRTVAGHLVVPLVISLPTMALTILRHAGNFDKANTAQARVQAARPVADLTATLRDRAASRWTPPGGGPAAPFTDLCVHTADMRVPLGLDHDIDPTEAEVGLDLLFTSGRGLIPRGRLRDLEFRANGVDRVWGSGDRVDGSAAHLLLAALGRRPFLKQVSGPGAAVLTARVG